jgi:transposase
MNDDHWIDSASSATLRMLLAQERAARQEVEQDLARLRAGLARQNERLVQIEGENATLRQDLQETRLVVTTLQEQNDLLRQQVAALQRENQQLRGVERIPKRPAPQWSNDRSRQESEDGVEGTRKKREQHHNHGRQRMSRVDGTVEHTASSCPQCGTALVGGWVHRRVQLIDLPSPAHAIVTEYHVMARRCPQCHTRVLPPAPAVIPGRIGRCRFGPRLLATVATWFTVERLPGRQIQERLAREYDLQLSHGGIIGLLQLVARQSQAPYDQLHADVRASPVVHMDETGWKQDGMPGYIWTASTATTCYFHYDVHRSGAVADALLDPDFAGTITCDFYAAYDHFLGPKQRCWAHLWRDIAALETEFPQDGVLAAWVVGVRGIYAAARGERPAGERGDTIDALRAREQRARTYERHLLLLCPETMAADRPEVTLCKRIRRYIHDLFVFVADPAVPPTNNAAERSLRGPVVARKISGGTRSAVGSTTRMTLTSIAATARLQGTNPTVVFETILRSSTNPAPAHAL